MQDLPIKSTILKFGLYLGLARVIWLMLFYTFDFHTNSDLGWTNMVSAIVLVLIFGTLAMLDYRNLNEGFVPFGKAFLIGLLTAIIGGLIYYVFNYIYTSFIETSILAEAIDAARQNMLKSMPEEQVDQMLDSGWMKTMFNPIWGTLIGSLLLAPLTGAIWSLIPAAILQRARPTSS